MSLRTQIAGLLIALSVVLVATTTIVQLFVVMPAFTKLEWQGADRNTSRCVDALLLDIGNLSKLADDWSAWDDMHQYAQDRNKAFEESNLVDEAFSNSHIDLICILDLDRKIVWGESRDMQTLELIDVPDVFSMLQDASSSMTQHQALDDSHEGIFLSSKGPILLASRPIVTTKREGPIQGSVVMGRFLNEAAIASLADRTHTSLDMWTVTDPNLPSSSSNGLQICAGSCNKHIEIIDSSLIHAYAVMNDINDRPAILLRLNIDREITAQGRVSAYMATGGTIGGGILTLLTMWFFLQWRIVGPLQQMATHASRVGENDDLKARLNLKRADEIGMLADKFDEMVGSLAESRKSVLNTAHRAGMAEIASEVLHNVGNAVNSANCSVEMLDESLDRSKITGLGKATTLLRDQAPRAAEFFGNDPRGLKLIDYIASLNDALLQERIDNKAEVTRLRETVRHIRDAIATQQTFAGRSNYQQDVDLQSLIDEILSMNQDLIRSSEVQVSVVLPQLPEVKLNKSKMTQVLVNLLRNAVQSMQCIPTDARRLSIIVRTIDDDGIELDVTDTGNGFSEKTRSQLFTHGFTTKPDGNGFGLHYCANAIRESGGDITAESDGIGYGAVFRIRLPHVLPQPIAAR